MSGLSANNLDAGGVRAATFAKTVRRKGTHLQARHALTSCWLKERTNGEMQKKPQGTPKNTQFLNIVKYLCINFDK
jgi:hypothetical protein